ncbi:lytic transglycosylase domain-containing protein [Saccharopolyspora gloriosae]|uniref:lytic transglycosylase domain-containing protein n=1 Tax=Saccharopolyspora gloriosae TaxID=455344 RepID=UPI001FB63027|nr:lytic transglycosylase domain-containing protein [Saccharopolyspora gloriosae]
MVRNRGPRRRGISAHGFGAQRRMRCYQAAALAGMLALGAADQTPWASEADVEASGSNAAHGTPPPRNTAVPEPLLAAQPAAVPERPGEGPRALEARAAPATPKYGIPATVLDSYLRAVDAQQRDDPGCGIAWSLLAGIGKVESGHARGGDVTPEGDLIHPIYGPALDGTNGTASIQHGGQSARAAGSMQFIPSSWARWAADGNHDGSKDPQNVHDASLAAARYLCGGGRDLTTSEDLRAAIFSYNHSQDYVNLVLSWMRAYESGGGGVPDEHTSSELLTLAAFESPSDPGSEPSAPAAPPAEPPPAAEQPQNPAPPPESQPEDPEPPQNDGPAPAPSPAPGKGVLQPVKQLLPPPVNDAVAPVLQPVEHVVGQLPVQDLLGGDR